MEKMKKIFGEVNMSWPKVLIFAVASAIFTAAMLVIDGLKESSFQDIGIAFECWILFAMFIIMNSKKMTEAIAKTFVFFLVSQPLIYLFQVPFSDMGMGLFGYYKRWAVITILTIPGAAIAYLVKKKNIISAGVLSVANAYLAYMSANYLRSAIFDFPHHLLSAIFCLALAVFFCVVFFDDKKLLKRLTVGFVAFVFVVCFIFTGRSHKVDVRLGKGNWDYTMDKEKVVVVEIDGSKAKIKGKHDGDTIITFTNDKGEVIEYQATVGAGNVFMTSIG